MATEYVHVQRDDPEWDRMWIALRKHIDENYGANAQAVFDHCGYMGESVSSGRHCFRAKEVNLPGGEYIGRVYFEIPDQRTKAEEKPLCQQH